MKQAILVWSFRQNIFLASLHQKSSISTHDGAAVRIPAIFTDKRGFIQVGTQIGNHGNKWKNVNLNAKTWYNLELMQYGLNNKVIG